MIIEAQKSNTELIGDIKEFKTGIDPKNLEFITTLLSSNLYSNPEQSFVREIVSNAWDSHVEAGNTDTPVLIRLDNTTNSITVRDFGVGLSPERFEHIYCNIGSSTKRESNDYIGGFGIGRFSALACSNIVYITSYYKGKAYYYIMTKDGNNITTNLVATLDTAEKDGVEVTLKNCSNFNNYYLALDYISFFPNIYIDCEGVIKNRINNSKVKYYNNFAVSTLNIRHKLLLGNVLYPLDTTFLDSEASNFIDDISNTGIVIRFKVGELNITPNRENIIYTNSTKELINSRIHEVKKEIISIVCPLVIRDYSNIYDYYSAKQYCFFYNFFNNILDTRASNITHYGFFRGSISLLDISITYKGEDLSSWMNLIRSAIYMRLPEIKGEIIGSKYRKNAVRDLSTKTISISRNQKLNPYIKRFLESKFINYTIISEISFEEFKTYFMDAFSFKTIDREELIICKACYDLIQNNTTHLEFNSNKEFLDFKNELKEKRSNINPIRDVILYIYDDRIKRTKRFNTLNDAIIQIKKVKRGVVFGNISDDEDKINLLSLKYIYITANKKVIEELSKLTFTNIVPKDKALKKMEKDIRIANTIFSSVGSYYYKLSSYEDTLNKELQHYYHIIVDEVMKLSNYDCDVVKKYTTEKDSYFEYICSKLEEFMGAVTAIKSKYDFNNYGLYRNELDFINCIAMKTKAYRMSYKAYKKVKSNILLRVLCRK